MGDAVSSLLFQPPPPTKLREHKIIWLRTERGSKIPAFYISYCSKNSGKDDIHDEEDDHEYISNSNDKSNSKSKKNNNSSSGSSGTSKSLTRQELFSPKYDPTDGITVLYSHANAEDLGSIYPWCKFMSKMLKVHLFAYDYTGYGMAYNEGEPSEEHCFSDIKAAYKFLRYHLKIPAQNIVLYGRSLGSGPSCFLAAESALRSQNNLNKSIFTLGQEQDGDDSDCDECESRQDDAGGVNDGKSSKQQDDRIFDAPVGGLILHAPFLSVYRIVVDTGCTVPGDKFPNVDFIPNVDSPTVLVHGTKDQIVPFYHSQRLYDALQYESRTRPLYIEGMGHNNVHSMVRPMFVERLTEYLDDHVWPYIVRKDKRNKNIKPLSRKEVIKQNRAKLEDVANEDAWLPDLCPISIR